MPIADDISKAKRLPNAAELENMLSLIVGQILFQLAHQIDPLSMQAVGTIISKVRLGDKTFTKADLSTLIRETAVKLADDIKAQSLRSSIIH